MIESNNLTIAQTFYTKMAEKKVADMEKYLHPEVEFSTPLAKVQGKEAYLEGLTNFTTFFETLTIRAKFASGDQVVLVYDLGFPAPIGNLPSVVLMTFEQGLIAKIELFYDSHPLGKRGKIFPQVTQLTSG